MRRIFVTILTCLISIPVFCQIGFTIPVDSGKVEIPFEQSNNLIIIPVTFNKKVILKFILDTSVEYSILSQKSVGDQLGMNYMRKVQLGIVNGKPSFGYSANGVQLSIGAATTSTNHSMLVLENDFMNLSNVARTTVHGVIGYDLFGPFVVHLDHSKSKLVLHPKSNFEPPKGYDEVQIDVVARKAFLPAEIVFENWDKEIKKFQIKTGATHTVLFNSDSNLFHLPARKLEIPLGMGPAGPIEGYVGRVRELKIGDDEFEDVIASFTKNEVGNSKETGSIGMGILSRFDMLVDFSGSKLYLRKNREYGKSFEYDLSGMRVDAEGENNFRVTHVIASSPAAKAGVQVGDRVLCIQGEYLTNENLNKLLRLLLEKEGKRIRLEIDRSGQKLEFSFSLVRLI
ncbi:MAG: aspartyl protease family protein [Ekhidna sp.]|uniref:aspartyl protease family protein n=1 Tax=Ekhidna sp. TaxID=2608089 RepID=UPI003296B97B